jgi:Thioredoxin-like
MRRYIMILTALLMSAPGVAVAENPIAVGSVHWGRNLDQALKTSGATGRPVLVLFQEVPGCSGCQDFGRTVLTNPQIVEAVEKEFLPVLVYNNRGEDRQLLERFDEPAWNYQVVRFLDAEGRDIIPRKDHIWTVRDLAIRMIATLQATRRPVPKYLQTLAEKAEWSE